MSELTKHQQRVVERIKELHAAGQPLNIDAVREREPKLLAAAYKPKKFWGWLQALEAAVLTYDDIRISLTHQVQCKICKGWYGHLGSHIARHDITTKEYREKFPDAELTTQSFRLRYTKKIHSFYEDTLNWEPIWSKEYIQDKVAFYYRKGYNLSCSSMCKIDFPLYSISNRYFNCWYSAVDSIGLNSEELRRYAKPEFRYITKQDIIHAIQIRHSDSKPLHHRALECAQNNDRPLLSRAVRLFGNWAKAIEAAGFDYDKIKSHRQRYPDKKSLKQAIKKRHSEGTLNHTDLTTGPQPDYGLIGGMQKHYGSIKAALKAAGITYREYNHCYKERPSKKTIIRTLQNRQQQGKTLFCSRLKQGSLSEQELLLNAEAQFGKWTNALVAAGIDIEKLYCKNFTNKYSTRKKIIEALQKRAIHMKPISYTSLQKGADKDRALLYTIKKHFGSISKARKEAGLKFQAQTRKCTYTTKEEIIEALKTRFNHNLPMNNVSMLRGPYKDPALLNCTLRIFGNVRKAVEEAGLPYEPRVKSPTERYPDRSSVKEKFMTLQSAGHPITYTYIYKKHSSLYYAAKAHFGTLPKAREWCGIKPEARPKKQDTLYPDKEAVIRGIRDRHKRGLSLESYNGPKGKNQNWPLTFAARREFGSWLTAIKAAGITRPPRKTPSNTRFPTRQKVLKELRKRHSAGISSSYSALQKGEHRNFALYKSIIKHFGSLAAAIDAAGV